jgi:hypothetical protein
VDNQRLLRSTSARHVNRISNVVVDTLLSDLNRSVQCIVRLKIYKGLYKKA